MLDDDLGVELMRLFRRLRATENPREKAALRQLIDAMLDRAQHVFAEGYRRVGRDHHL